MRESLLSCAWFCYTLRVSSRQTNRMKVCSQYVAMYDVRFGVACCDVPHLVILSSLSPAHLLNSVNLPLPQLLTYPLDGCAQMAAKGAEWETKRFRRLFLG